jgi:hypothetical protein
MGGQGIECDEPVAVPLQPDDCRVQKVRGYFQMRIGIEGQRLFWPDMMQRENRPTAARIAHQPSRAKEPGGVEATRNSGALGGLS